MKKYIIILLFFIISYIPAAYCIDTPDEYKLTIGIFLKEGHNQIALNKANEFVLEYPSTHQSYMVRAFIYQYIFNDYYSAIADYDKAIQYSHDIQDTVRYYIAKGKCYAGLQKHTEALEQYNLVPLNYVNEMNSEERLEYYKRRAASEFLLELYEAAIKDYTKAIELEPNAGFYFMRANAYIFHNKDFGNFVKDLRMALALCQYKQTNECELIDSTYRFLLRTKAITK